MIRIFLKIYGNIFFRNIFLVLIFTDANTVSK